MMVPMYVAISERLSHDTVAVFVLLIVAEVHITMTFAMRESSLMTSTRLTVHHRISVVLLRFIIDIHVSQE